MCCGCLANSHCEFAQNKFEIYLYPTTTDSHPERALQYSVSPGEYKHMQCPYIGGGSCQTFAPCSSEASQPQPGAIAIWVSLLCNAERCFVCTDCYRLLRTSTRCCLCLFFAFCPSLHDVAFFSVLDFASCSEKIVRQHR